MHLDRRVSYGENGEHFQGGEDVETNSEFDNYFRMYVSTYLYAAFSESVLSMILFHHLIVALAVQTHALKNWTNSERAVPKCGKRSYHLRWSFHHDLQSCSTRSLTLFLRAIKAHILKTLQATYSSGKSCIQVF